ncbi:MAG: protein-disulfide reductase DsbD [Sulfurospirillaceae bacterium]|nr:protein-disulfide reductase DsbD [Sulfurospirillaceae bacterium]MDD2825900.1 protein-disulfide reductase DsbD [Sulfurospirillaceae bacterium]
MKKSVQIILLYLFLALNVYASQAQKILTPEEAFNISMVEKEQNIVISVILGDKIYLYDDKLTLELISPERVNLDNRVQRPTPEPFHEYITQRKSFDLIVPITLIKEIAGKGSYTLKLSFQGCSELGLCYQPMEKTTTFSLNNTPNNAHSLSEQDTIAYSLANSNWILVLASFFGFGLLLSLTPCVFPMIPILSSIIVSQSSGIMNAKKGFFLSLVYVLAMSVAYTIAGILAGLFGANLQASLQNPWVLSAFSAIFVLLAFSMFGFYEIQMPSFIQTKLNKKSDNAREHGIVGVAIMGFMSALIVGPCVAAPLAGALIYIGQTGNAFLGGSALFIMSLGMGIPLLIVGTTAGKYMPRPGGWMDTIKSIFGVMMLGVAIWMLSRIIPNSASMFLWMILILISSIYWGALEPLHAGAKGFRKIIKSIVVLFFLYAVILLVGFVSGATNPLLPFEKFTTAKVENHEVGKSVFERITSREALTIALKKAKKPVILDFYADWCVNCIELEKFTFSDSRVKDKMKNFTLLQIDVTQNSIEDKALQKEFDIFGPPAILFFEDSLELKDARLIGFKNADDFLKHLDMVLK